jgi:hypothetical protein
MLERLGETLDFGFFLLDILKAHGWTVAVQPAFAGGGIDVDEPGVLVIASKNGYEIRRVGRSTVDVAGEVFAEAARYQRIRA